MSDANEPTIDTTRYPIGLSVTQDVVTMAGLVGRTVTHAEYRRAENCEVIEFDNEYRLTVYRDRSGRHSFLLMADEAVAS